jgi:predicted nuclease of predicted toxin-antitoxin system
VSGSPPPSYWRFLVDENLPRSLASDLVALGHFAEHVYDIGIGGAKDPAVFAYAQSQQLTILTGDKDFSNIRVYTPPHAGIIVVEIPDVMPPESRKQLILRQLSTLTGQTLDNLLVIIEPNRVRVRR